MFQADLAEKAPGETAPGQQAIEIKDFNLYYGHFHALTNVNMAIKKKKVTAIIGPSGCGKSTLLRSINRMNDIFTEVRTSGDILIGGLSAYGKKTDLIELRKTVGMVFQRPNPFPLSVYQNVAFGLKLHTTLNNSEILERVENSMKGVGIWDELKDKLDAPAITLSGELQQRLCIARVTAVSPSVVLMDEPCSALDPIATQHIEELIRELKRDYTIVIVTHNMAQAARVSDETAYFYLGQLIEMGPTGKIFRAPDRQETEDYITGRFG
ncbi:MAG TPA: phosphate ABC transporter ATP-binding protein PstB [Verrucomicrobiae bacterium]|jgi:phosphate transport system ATP-binding protein|nr:phosphate ABC transporter ATP-binding protein PstB [Verrucomicrobiae bacterium]